MNYEFQEQNIKGKRFEFMAFYDLQQKNLDPKFNPNKNNKEYDLICSEGKIEVKADFFQNRNFPFEIVHINKETFEHSKGWVLTTESDIIYFYKPALKEVFFFDTTALKIFVRNRLKSIRTLPVTQNEKFITLNVIVPESEINDFVLFHKEEMKGGFESDPKRDIQSH